jgi:predicted MFS family arabinose efflux permease
VPPAVSGGMDVSMENEQNVLNVPAASGSAEEKKKKRSLYVRYALIMFLFYFTVSMTAYVTVYLEGNGYTGTQIGTIMALAGVIGAVTLPLWGMLSDRIRSARVTFVTVMVLSAGAFVLVPMTSLAMIGSLMISTVFIAIGMALRGPGNNLVIGWMVKESTYNNINYSSVRLWGSVGFASMLLLLSILVPAVGIDMIFYGTPVISAILVGACFLIREDRMKRENKVKFKDLKVGRIFKNFYFMMYLILVVGMVIYDAVTMTYMPFLIKSVGGNTDLTGLIIGMRAFTEMAIMLTIIFFKKRVPLPYLLIGAGMLFAVEHMLYPLAGQFVHIVLISVISGVASGVFLGIGPSYVLSIVPNEINNTAQTLWGSMMLAAVIAGSFAGGIIMDAVGIKSLLFGCGLIILAITVFFALTIVVGRRLFKLNTPESVYKPITQVKP